MKKRGVIFDFDGTLIDSMPMWHDLDRRLLAKYDIIAPSDISDTVKAMTTDQSSAYLVERFHLPVSAKELSRQVEALASDAYRNEIPLKNGADTILSALYQQGIICAVATVTYPSLLDAALDRLDIRKYLHFTFTPADTTIGKHSREFYDNVAKKMELSPSELIVIEDALYAAKTAKEAGFYVIGMKDALAAADFPMLEQICDRTVSCWDELCEDTFFSLFL